jgi:hypothetical protein
MITKPSNLIILSVLIPCLFCVGWSAQKKPVTKVLGEIMGLGVKFSQKQPLSDLEMLTDLGVRWVRDDESWGRVERTPGVYEFPDDFKKRLAFYKAKNIGICYGMWYDNTRAYPNTPENPHNSVNPEAYGKYAAACARMLKESGVEFVLEVWNEPHNFVLAKLIGGDRRGEPPCQWLDHYIKMLHAAVKEVKAFDPTIKVLSNEDLTLFHYRFLEAGLPPDLDGFAFHPYMRGSSSNPEVAQEGSGSSPAAPFVLVDPDKSFRSMVRRLREQAEIKMGKTPELWITEFGCPVRENVGPDFKYSLGKATEYELTGILVRAFIGAEAAGVKTFLWFSSWDGPDGPMGLLSVDGHKRQSYYAYKTLSNQLGEYSMVKQIAGGSHLTSGLQAYLFAKGNDLKVIAWTIGDQPTKLATGGALNKAQLCDVLGGKVNPGEHGFDLGVSPIYISGIKSAKKIEKYFRSLDHIPNINQAILMTSIE